MNVFKLKPRAIILLVLPGLAALAALSAGVYMAQGTSCQQTNTCNAVIPAQFFVVNDAQGPNDEPGQKDITRLGRWNHPVGDPLNGYIDIFISWDEVNPTSQTFDACALFDSNGDTNVDYAICPQLAGGSNKDETAIPKMNLAAGAPYQNGVVVYTCNSTLQLNCGGALPMSPQPPSLKAGDLAAADNTKELKTKTDPFASDDVFPYDTTARVQVLLSEINPNAKLTNVCTYPSHSPTSDPSDCLANAGGGFLNIIKQTTSGNGTFTFNVSPVPAGNVGGACNPAAAGCVSYAVTTANGLGSTGISMNPGSTVAVQEWDASPTWNLDSVTCVLHNGNTTGSVDLVDRKITGITIEADNVTTCTFQNSKQPAKVTVTKVVVNDNGGTATVGQYTLKVGSQTVTSGVQANIPEGTYQVTETGPTAGYTASYSGACAPNGNLDVVGGQSYSCTITNNDNPPSLTLSKVVTNDNGGSAPATAFTLSAAGPTPISGSGGATSGAGFNAGTYTLSESGPAGYTASAWSCSGGSQNGSQITVGLGQSATCTITNNDIQPQLKVIKKMKNDNGGTSAASDFTMIVSGNSPSPASFAGSESGTTIAINAGNYSVSETGPAGYAGAYSADCSGAIAVGQTKTCTVTNDDAAGSLTIVKHVINNNGGTATAGDFTMHINAGQASDNSVAGSENGVTVTIDAGSFNVTESGPSGYAATLVGCTGTMAPGGSATCTITNDDVAPTLVVVKEVNNDNGGTAAPSAFSGSINGSVGSYSWSGASTSTTLTTAGTYTVTESAAAGYTVSYSSDCSGSISVGQTKTCTVSNNDIAPSLTLLKIVNTGLINDPAAPPSAFTVGTSGGPTNISGAGTAVSGPTFKAGTYTLGETGPSGYSASGWSCSGQGAQSGNQITLGIGQTAACSITNNLLNISPNIKLTKDATPKNLDSTGGTVTFSVTITNLSGPFDPYTITSLTDTVYGDLTNPTDAKPQDNNTCGNAIGYVIPGGGSYTCSWTSYFPPLAANQTLSEHDVVMVTGNDDDSAGASSIGSASDDATVTQVVPMLVTNSSLCVFDTDPNTPGRQFNRLFTQNSYYGLTATNPGQFFYNVAKSGPVGSVTTITLELPWPFVTQGNMPIHVYDSVEFVYRPECNGLGYIPGNAVATIHQETTLGDYLVGPPPPPTPGDPLTGSTFWGYPATPGSLTLATATSSTKYRQVTFEVTIPASGFVYVNQHMDDGLKGPKVDINGDGAVDVINYLKDTINDATEPATGKVLIPQNNGHRFTVSATNALNVMTVLGDDAVYNSNIFKKNTGVGGVVFYNGSPVPGLTVQLLQGSTVVGAAITDSDGYYSIQYKHTGKAADYTVQLVVTSVGPSVFSAGISSTTPTGQTVTLKSNGFAPADFFLVQP